MVVLGGEAVSYERGTPVWVPRPWSMAGPSAAPASLPDAISAARAAIAGKEREFFIDNLLVQTHLIIEMIIVDRPCAMGV